MQVLNFIETCTYPLIDLALMILCLLKLRNRGGEYLAGGFGAIFLSTVAWQILNLADSSYEHMNIHIIMQHISYILFLTYTALFIVGLLKLASAQAAGKSPATQKSDMPLNQILFSFRGRINRAVFWAVMSVGNALVLFFYVYFVLNSISNDNKTGAIIAVIFFVIISIPLCWIGLAIQVKRWHDRNKPGTMVFINLIPFVGLIWAFIEMGFLEGSQGSNQYGEDPLRPATKKKAK